MKTFRTLILNTSLIITLFVSCKKEENTPTPTPPPPPTVVIGQSYQGGIVAYVRQPGEFDYDANVPHGLIVAPSHQGQAPWGCSGTLISGADGIWNGNFNTEDIMYGCNTPGIAARLCGDLVLGGYSDWFLPSQNQLNQLCINKDAIGGFAGLSYWSSTEYDANVALRQDFGAEVQFTNNKSQSYYVRAVRAF